MFVLSKKGKDGKLRWYIDFYADGIRKRECVGHSKTLAKKALAKRTTEVSEERYINKSKGGGNIQGICRAMVGGEKSTPQAVKLP